MDLRVLMTLASFKSIMFVVFVVLPLDSQIGVAVLAVAQAMGTLGWVAGSLTLLFVYLMAMLVSRLLSSIYEVDGVQHPRFFEAVGHILGKLLLFAFAS